MTKHYTDHGPTQAFIEQMDRANSQADKWRAEKRCQSCGGTEWRCKAEGYVGTLCESCLKALGERMAASGDWPCMNEDGE